MPVRQDRLASQLDFFLEFYVRGEFSATTDTWPAVISESIFINPLQLASFYQRRSKQELLSDSKDIISRYHSYSLFIYSDPYCTYTSIAKMSVNCTTLSVMLKRALKNGILRHKGISKK